MKILNATPKNAIHLFEKAISKNEPLIFPTDTIYGIGALIRDIEANTKIYEIKGREKRNPFPLLIGNLDQLSQIIDHSHTNEQQKVLGHIWPGSFTVIFNARKSLNRLFTLNGNVAVRLTNVDWLREVINYFNSPLSATSANLSGEEYYNGIDHIIEKFQNKIDYILTNDQNNSEPSTILDFTSKQIQFIRNPKNLTVSDLFHT